MTIEKPIGWEKSKLSDILTLKNGFAFKSSSYKDIGVPILRISDIQEGLVSPVNAKCIDEDEQYEEYVVNQGDILIAMSGATTGKFGIFNSSRKAYQNQRVGRFFIYSKKLISNSFVYYLLFSLKREIEKSAYGGAQPNISSTKIESLDFLLPPTNEQIRIVEKVEELFSELDKGIESLKTAKAQLAVYRQALLKHAFEGKLTEQWRASNADKLESPEQLLTRIQQEREARYQQQLDDWKQEVEEWETDGKEGKKPAKPKQPKEINLTDIETDSFPEGWCGVRAEVISDFVTKGTTPKKEDLYSGSGEIPFLKVYNLTKTGKLDFTIDPTYVTEETHKNFLARSQVFPGDVLMNIVGPPLGKVSIVPSDFPQWNINQAIVRYRTNILESHFLANYLLSENVVRSMMRKAKATAGQFNLTLEICRDVILPVCSESEQSEIVNILSGLLSVVDSTDREIEANLKRSEVLKQSILKKAFSGQLVPQNSDDEPASELLKKIAIEKAELAEKEKAEKAAARKSKSKAKAATKKAKI